MGSQCCDFQYKGDVMIEYSSSKQSTHLFTILSYGWCSHCLWASKKRVRITLTESGQRQGWHQRGDGVGMGLHNLKCDLGSSLSLKFWGQLGSEQTMVDGWCTEKSRHPHLITAPKKRRGTTPEHKHQIWIHTTQDSCFEHILICGVWIPLKKI